MFVKFQKHLETNFPQIKDQNILLALSGGLDSCVLLDLIFKLGLRPALAHCNFQLRGIASDNDARWVEALAQEKGLEFHVQNFNTQVYALNKKVSIQMAARDLRYQWFETLSKQNDYNFIFVAHHADDVLETFMINVMRGTGLKGLLGIPERRGKILRPLLPFSREEIKQYAFENKILYREDESNAKTDYLRNALRHEVIPKWKKRDSNFDEQFRETLKYLGQAQVVLDNVLEDFKNKNFSPFQQGFKISINELEVLSSLSYYLHALFAPYGFVNLEDLEHLMHSQSGKQLFSDTHRLIRDRECFLLTPIEESPYESYSIESELSAIEIPIRLTFMQEKNFKIGDSKSLVLDRAKLKFPLTLRKWKQSDYFYPSGLKGSKKLSKYFKDEKYSLLEKEAQWLLCSGEKIVWVIGKRGDQRFLADADTKDKWLIRYHD
ncbi:MAG: tRNA lysidine(34) synthetase TilS [Bacteroidota bacterium]|nr:tRNA lysidine(34) synthetase TilS [Bacteroidota bacterium]